MPRKKKKQKIPFNCQGCVKVPPQVGACNIRKVSFQTFGLKCPREKVFLKGTVEKE